MTDIDKLRSHFVTLSDTPPLFFLHYLNFLRYGKSQHNKPYIHFVDLEKTHLLKQKLSDYLLWFKS